MINIRKNYILNTANQLLTLVVPLITAPYLSRVLTSDGIGIQSYTNSIVAYFTLFAVMGSSSFGQREIAYLRDDRRKTTEAFWNVMAFRGITTLITFLAYMFFLSHVQQHKVYFLILSIQIINVALDITWLFQGVEEFGKIVTRSVAVRLLHTICILLFIKSQNDLWLYLLMMCGFNAIGYLLMWAYLPKYIGRPKNVKPFRDAKDVILLFLPTVATQVYVILDKSMIGWITNSTYQNGCYEQAEKIAKISLSVVTSISTIVLPRIANLYRKGEIDSAKAILYQGYRFVLLLSIPMTFGLISIADIFVPVFFGAGYDMAIVLLQIYGLIIIPISLAHITGYSYLIPTGQQNVYTVSVTIAAIVNLLMNLVSIPRWGAIGAAIGSVAAEVTGIAIQMAFCFSKKQLSIKRVFHGSEKCLIASVVMLINLRFVSMFVSTGVIGLTVLIACGGITYFLMLCILKHDFFCKHFYKTIDLISKKIRRC